MSDVTFLGDREILRKFMRQNYLKRKDVAEMLKVHLETVHCCLATDKCKKRNRMPVRMLDFLVLKLRDQRRHNPYIIF